MSGIAQVGSVQGRVAIGGVRITALLLGCGLLLLALRVGIQSYRLEALQLLLVASLLFIACYSRSIRSNLLLAAYAIVFVFFARLRGVAEDAAIVQPQYEYPVLADRLLGLVPLPTHWLQDTFYSPGTLGFLDVGLTFVYVSFFLTPHLIILLTWKTRPELLPRALVAFLLTLILGLVIHFVVPTAPPWLASEAGTIDEVHRLVPEFSALVAGDTYDRVSAVIDGNEVAAMPSLHTALTVIVALVAAKYGRLWTYLGVGYVALMGLALVYLGEHYVVDEVAGIALALAAWGFVDRLQSTHAGDKAPVPE